MLLETALVAFTTFFATVGPIDVAMLFAAMTAGNSAAERRSIAWRGSLIGFLILLAFCLAGRGGLELLGISLPALRTSGGILLLLMAIDMVFARPSGGTSTTGAETAEGLAKADITVFPLATPLIAGPGAMGAAVLLAANADGDPRRMGLVLAALAAVILLTWILMQLAGPVQKRLGVTGQQVVTRVVGVLLAALAVQFIFDGLRNSGLFGGL